MRCFARVGHRLCVQPLGRRPLSQSPGVEAIQALRGEFVKLVEGKDFPTFGIVAHRRFIVPKDEISYKQATQLDPQDSILLCAIVHQFG